jgi:myo-inositol 2-dehydrogenase/D-chiro-inositol 1-dehydrogenase
VTLRIGVVGTGVMGAEHARVLAAAVGGEEVSPVADLDMARAHDVAASVGAEVFRDPLRMIGSDSVDTVVIASHDSSH